MLKIDGFEKVLQLRKRAVSRKFSREWVIKKVLIQMLKTNGNGLEKFLQLWS